MKKPVIGLLAASAIAFGVALPGFAGNEFANKYNNNLSQERVCSGPGGNNTVTYNGPDTMWPPNHKMQPVSATARSANDSNPLANDTTIAITPSATDGDGVTGGDGGLNHDPDWTPGEIAATGDGEATANFALRSERSGKGEGRTYVLDWEATFNDGTECTSLTPGDGLEPFKVFVPHDMRGGAGWK